MSVVKTDAPEPGRIEAHRLLGIATRLREVRRRYAVDAGDAARFAPAMDRLDSIVADLDDRLRPGGRPVRLDDLELSLAAIEEMVEAVGFPAYARVVGSIRASLSDPLEDAGSDDEPPPPRRFVPRRAEVAPRSRSEADVDEWEIRAAAESARRHRRFLNRFVVVVACAALAAALLLVRPWERIGQVLSVPSEPAAVEVVEPVAPEAAPAPAPEADLRQPGVDEAPVDDAGDQLRFQREIGLAEWALHRGDPDLALRHFAAAAAIDRHHRRVTEVAERLISVLIDRADAAFDNGEWEIAGRRVEDARHIARGLYLDTAAIEQTAQRHALLTRFEDVMPEDREGIARAVGRTVRVTLRNRDRLFGRLEAFDRNALVLDVHSGVEGGGVRYSTTVPLATVQELRVFDAERPSETVLGP